MKKEHLQIVLTIFCIGVIALSLYLSPDLIRAQSYEDFVKDEPPVFSGVIHIWQISSWRVAQSSKTLCLLDVAKEFEKKNKFVFVEVENVSIEDYQKAISQGKYPDVLSFPAEMKVELDKCSQINSHDSLLPILQDTYLATNKKTIPWQYTSSVIIANSKELGEKSLSTDKYQNLEQVSTLINTLATNETSTLGSIYALVPLAVSNANIDTKPVDISTYNAWNRYISKDCDVIYGSIWQNYSMNRLLLREKGFDCEYIIPSMDIPRYYWTQNFCIFSSDADKNTMINEYIDMVLSDRYQIKIADVTASFPAINVTMEYDGIRKAILDGDYNSSIAIIPGKGVSHEEIAKALSGDITQKEALLDKIIIK